MPTLHLDRKATKRNKGGKLPLAEKLQGSLEAYYIWLRGWYEGAWLLPGYDGKHLTSRAIQLRVKLLANQAGIRKKISAASVCRKFYVQRLLDQGLDVRSVMELSRHSSLASLHCYLVVNEEAARSRWRTFEEFTAKRQRSKGAKMNRQIINVQMEAGRPEYETLEQKIVVNHPENSDSGTCKTCEPLNLLPVEAAGYPPFHPHCVCTVEWLEVK